MENKATNFRINILDGFRAIAILIVLSFHFFSRWTSLYPYGNKYDFFIYGKMGVQFFFIISGFVILYTLENTDDYITFWKKRMIRLFPSMLFASLITYFIFNLFDTTLLFPTSHFFKNVLASITFIPPDALASLLKLKTDLDYISGCYWSLWPEIQFYLFVSTIYFFNKNKFPLVFFSLTSILIFGNFVLHHIYSDNHFIEMINHFLKVFTLIESLPCFCFGVLFYLFYKNKTLKNKIPVYLKICFLGLLLLQVYEGYLQLLKLGSFFIFLILFIVLIYYPKLIIFLENKILLKIGVSSYFLYLIHENIGVLMIYKYGGFLKAYEFIIPLVFIIILIAISIFYTYTIDRKINNYLKKIVLKKKNTIPKGQVLNLNLQISGESVLNKNIKLNFD
jgi:peptidoglycan/LPS O-acetylase OafA/YrhL